METSPMILCVERSPAPMSPVPSERGDFPTLWRLCIESPSQPKLASSLHNKRLSYWRLTGFGRNDGRGARRHRHLERRIYEKIISRCFILLPLAGEVPRSGKGGGERSEPITECLSCHVIQKANPVTLSFPLEVAKELDS